MISRSMGSTSSLMGFSLGWLVYHVGSGATYRFASRYGVLGSIVITM